MNLALTLTKNDDERLYIQTLAILHEELDDKLNTDNPHLQLHQFLTNANVSNEWHERLITDIQSIGFKGGFSIPKRTRAAQLVSDDDLLDASDTIGIARTFQYNGSVKKSAIL